MNKNYQKVIFSAIIVIILMIWNFNYSYIYLIGFMIAMLFIVYDTNRYYQQQINFYKREKENEIREVEGEKDFNHKILNSLIKTMNLPMIFVNKEGTIIFTNQSFRDAFKIKHLRGKYYKDIFTDQLLNIVDQSYIFERKFSTAVCIDERYYQIETTPVFRDDVAFDGSIILFTDVTQVKEIEKMQKQFFSDISHELKTPLASISGYAELIETGMAKEEDICRFAGEIHKSSLRLLSLINDIIELSELDVMNGQMSKTKVSLTDEVVNCVEILQMNAEKHNVNISLDKCEDGCVIDANQDMIQEIIYNLCDNAIRYNKPEGNVWVSVFREKDNIILQVRDNGIGIPEKEQQHIFERFYRVDKARSKKTGGTGLGLAIVKHIAEQHNAEIKIESYINEGTTISVIF